MFNLKEYEEKFHNLTLETGLEIKWARLELENRTSGRTIQK